MADPTPFELRGPVVKVDQELGLVFGYGAVCTEDGQPYYDEHDEHTSEAEALTAALDFVENWQTAGQEHQKADPDDPNVVKRGTVPFVFPLLSDVAEALEVQTKTTGVLIAMKPDAETLQKFVSGELTAFSMGGTAVRVPADA